MEKAIKQFNPLRVKEIEAKISHDLMAVVKHLQELVPEETKAKVHPSGTTSYDIIDSARALMFHRAAEECIIPRATEVLGELLNLSERYADQIQIGRTHGQWTSPVTFGFYTALIAKDLADRIKELERTSNALGGKVSGIVGTYASQGIGVGLDNAQDFEDYVLIDILGLKVGNNLGQIISRSNLADFTNAIITTANTLGKFANDMRNLQRSEINEVGEFYDKEKQTGSSADPNKRNPIFWENIYGMVKHMRTGILNVYDQQLTDHQRDLSNSIEARFEPQHTSAGLYLILQKMLVGDKGKPGALATLTVDQKTMKSNYAKSIMKSVAEPLNAILRKLGHPDAHEAARVLARKSGEDVSIIDALRESEELKEYIDGFTDSHWKTLTGVIPHIGLASVLTKVYVQELREDFGLE